MVSGSECTVFQYAVGFLRLGSTVNCQLKIQIIARPCDGFVFGNLVRFVFVDLIPYLL